MDGQLTQVFTEFYPCSWVRRQCQGQSAWGPGTHHICGQVGLSHSGETSRSSIWYHLDDRDHSRVCKKLGRFSELMDTDFSEMCRLDFHSFHSHQIWRTSQNLERSRLQVWRASELHRSHWHWPQVLVLEIDCRESLRFWKAGPRTSQLVHSESSTAGCSLRRRPGSPPASPSRCSSGGRRRRSSSSLYPQCGSRRNFCHLLESCSWRIYPRLRQMKKCFLWQPVLSCHWWDILDLLWRVLSGLQSEGQGTL